MSLFQKSVENKYLNELDSVLIDQKYKQFQEYFGNTKIQENITKKLYADYSKFREAIYNNLVKNHTEDSGNKGLQPLVKKKKSQPIVIDKLTLFKKTQKLLDRFLFVFFAEDRLLLPPNSISEIAKLSLWLRTAQKGRKLIKKGEPVWLSEKEEIIVSEMIAEIVELDKLNVIAYNICGDHMHLLLVCEEEELPKIVQKMKSMSARACNIEMRQTVPGTMEHCLCKY